MLVKITAIKNVGRFRNSAAPGNPQLSKHVLILAPNGYGKTTLCAVLRSLSTGDPSAILGRKTLGATGAASVEILFDAGLARFDGAGWNANCSNIEIFDGVFVADNVHSGEAVELDHRRNLYRIIVGSDGVELAERDTELAAESRAKTGEVTAAAKAIQPYLPQRITLETFVALPGDPDIDAKIIQQELIVNAIQQADTIKAREALSEFSMPNLPDGLTDLLARTIDDVSQDAEQVVSAHLSKHGWTDGGGNWLAAGLEHTRDTCPFCDQPVQGLALVAAYRTVFSERYKTLVAEIGRMKMQTVQQFGDAALGRLELMAEQNKAALEFWTKYCAFVSSPLTLPSGIIDAARELGSAATGLLDRKSSAPLEPVHADDAFTDILAAYERASASVEVANQRIRAANALIVDKKSSTDTADLRAAEAELVRRKAIKMRHSDAFAPLCDEYSGLIAEKDAIEIERTAVREELNEHTISVLRPYERRINEYLDAFNAGFSIAETKHSYPGGIATSSYQLVINNTAVDVGDGRTPPDQPSFKNTLSSGDRTTLALGFFLAHLERDPALATKTVVFDDPFNSQDAFRRRQTIHEIMKVARNCAQIVVLSHDATFLKQLWDKSPAAERVSLTIADHRAQGSKIMPIDLERACQGRTATDIDDLQTYLTTGAGALIDVIRKIRVVLETFCRTIYQTSFLPADWLGDIVRKIREGGAGHPAAALYDELDQINDYTSEYHHGEDALDATPDQIDPTELKGFVRRTLKIVNALQA